MQAAGFWSCSALPKHSPLCLSRYQDCPPMLCMCCIAADSQLDFALRDSHLAGAVAHVLVEYFNKKQTQVGCCCRWIF